MKPPVRYSDDLEQIEPGEGEVAQEMLAAFDHILKTTHKDMGHAVRAVHAKAHAVLEGEMAIDSFLPPELAQGIFARPGRLKAWLRISTNPGDIISDKVSLPRGLALKVGGVRGERLPEAEGDTQDFLLVNSPVFGAAKAKDFAGQLKLISKTTDRAEGGKVALSRVLQAVNGALGAVGLHAKALDAIGGAPQVHPLGETYFSVTPFRYGDYVARFRLRPLSPSLTRLTGAVIDTSGGENPIRRRMQQDMAALDGEWAFEVQLLRDPAAQPVEDATVEWPEDQAPFVQVAKLVIPAQDSWDDRRVMQVDEMMRFSPWTGLAAHRPLGSINRARRPAYPHSADFRAAMNGCPIHEP